jgi:mono/diheme cytochrome c family protein
MAHRVSLSLLAAGFVAASAGAQAQDLKRGEYLAKIMDCTGCHTTGALAGQPDEAMFLGGSNIGFEIPGLGIFYPPNLTSDNDTGTGKWSTDDLIKAIRTGARPDGRQLVPIMPYMSYAALTDADSRDLAAYLKSVKPVQHKAPANTKAGEAAKAPYFSVVIPKQ